MLDRGLPQQAGEAEERSDRLRVAERGAQRGKAALDFARSLVHRHLVEGEGVGLAVVGDRMALVVDAPHGGGISLHHAADHEERGLHAFGGEQIEDAIGIGRQRTVVEGQHHLVVVERQRFPILPAANARVFVHVDHESAADPERVGRAFGSARRPDAEQRGEQNGCGNGAAHGPAFTPVGPNPERTPGPDRESRPSLYRNSRGRQFNDPLKAGIGGDLRRL